MMAEAGGPRHELAPLEALVDTACAKTVAGEDWANKHKAAAAARGIDCDEVPEREPFRFGPEASPCLPRSSRSGEMEA